MAVQRARKEAWQQPQGQRVTARPKSDENAPMDEEPMPDEYLEDAGLRQLIEREKRCVRQAELRLELTILRQRHNDLDARSQAITRSSTIVESSKVLREAQGPSNEAVSLRQEDSHAHRPLRTWLIRNLEWVIQPASLIWCWLSLLNWIRPEPVLLQPCLPSPSVTIPWFLFLNLLAIGFTSTRHHSSKVAAITVTT